MKVKSKKAQYIASKDFSQHGLSKKKGDLISDKEFDELGSRLKSSLIKNGFISCKNIPIKNKDL